LLSKDYAYAGEQDTRYDFRSRDGQHVLKLKQSLHSTRDLSAALFQLASLFADRAEITYATLVARLPKMGADRVQEEWRRLQKMLRPQIGKRLRMIALAVDRDIIIPDGDELRRVMLFARDAFRCSERMHQVGSSSAPWTEKTFEAWRVLLDAWLRGEDPLPIHEIVRRSGCSYPTVAATIDRLQRNGEIERSRNRSAMFRTLPRRSLVEILTLSTHLRQTIQFVDTSGRPSDVVGLLRRITSKAEKAMVAVGGVVAARHYTPNFDLNGLPRIDITTYRGASIDWLNEADPAMDRVGMQGQSEILRSPVLVVHRVLRAAAQFDAASGARLPWAGPAETLLDLFDLRLTSQAEDFVQEMRAMPKKVKETEGSR